MAYALRHVADLQALFAEFARVLKPGGQLLVMEITRPENVVASAVLRLYMRVIVPTITRVVRGSADAQELMRYYWDTIEYCVPPAAIIDAMSAVGLHRCQRRVELGLFSEYSAGKS
jgi:demethylmenaquinone methyltransferase/2-methoxy-6-polyprenyl-1,4-benzoquinol methylase